MGYYAHGAQSMARTGLYNLSYNVPTPHRCFYVLVSTKNVITDLAIVQCKDQPFTLSQYIMSNIPNPIDP